LVWLPRWGCDGMITSAQKMMMARAGAKPLVEGFTVLFGSPVFSSSATSVLVPYPSGIEAGDRLFVTGLANNSGAVGTISGWTTLSVAGDYGVDNKKVADGTESGTVALSVGATARNIAAGMFAIRHSSGVTPDISHETLNSDWTGVYGASPSATLAAPAFSYSEVLHILNYVNGSNFTMTADASLTPLSSGSRFYGYSIIDAVGQTITSTTSAAVSIRSYPVYI